MKHLIFSPTVQNLSSLMPIFKFDHMNQNQGRSFGPLLGLFLINLLAKAVSAKYLSYFPYHLQHDPESWLAYNKPIPNYHHQNHYSQWYPIKNPYESHGYYPTLTTASPYLGNEHPVDYNDYHADYDYGNFYPNYDKLIPSASNNVNKQTIYGFAKTTPPSKNNITTPKTTTTPTVTTVKQTTTPSVTTVQQTTTLLKDYQTSPIETTTVSTLKVPIQEPVAAGSSFNARRQPQKNRKRNRYPQRRRRPSQTPEYYDSYEDYYQSNRRRRPQFQSAESYYNDDYDSFESTTRYFKKQKRRPTRKNNRNQNRNGDSFEIETNTERFNPNTEIVIVRQAQTTTTTTTTATPPTGTTEPTTIVTNTTVSTTTSSSNNSYGYGPSNGNEQVSFTYGPPIGKYQYQVPYIDWYAQEETKNAIVKRVRDIVGDRN